MAGSDLKCCQLPIALRSGRIGGEAIGVGTIVKEDCLFRFSQGEPSDSPVRYEVSKHSSRSIGSFSSGASRGSGRPLDS